MRRILPILFFLSMIISCALADPTTRPAVEWIRPDGSATAQPIWGIAGGLSVGLAPTPGPRGLIRIYTPYLDQHAGRIMNFIAVEPIVAGNRGLSEIEASSIDHAQGKQMWTADTVDLNHPPAAGPLARGVVTRDGDIETFTFFLIVEPFTNGARPIVKISFRSDRPHGVSLTTLAAAGSAPMESCVLTATMGNFARLRHLKLKDKTIDAATVFANQTRGFWDFYPWTEWPASELTHAGDDVTVSATGDLDPTTAAPAPAGWRYEGRPAIQTWTTAARPGLLARVNGRSTFWGTQADIPGGPAFENFELKSLFEPGQEFRFSIEPE